MDFDRLKSKQSTYIISIRQCGLLMRAYTAQLLLEDVRLQSGSTAHTARPSI